MDPGSTLRCGRDDTPALRQAAYRAVFDHPLDDASISALRDATNASWVLGNDRFKGEIVRLTGRRVAHAPPSMKEGGGRRALNGL